MEKFQIVVKPVPDIRLWEIHIVGVGVTQSTSPNDADIEVMARDYLDAMGRNSDAILEITHATDSFGHSQDGSHRYLRKEPGAKHEPNSSV